MNVAARSEQKHRAIGKLSLQSLERGRVIASVRLTNAEHELVVITLRLRCRIIPAIFARNADNQIGKLAQREMMIRRVVDRIVRMAIARRRKIQRHRITPRVLFVNRIEMITDNVDERLDIVIRVEVFIEPIGEELEIEIARAAPHAENRRVDVFVSRGMKFRKRLGISQRLLKIVVRMIAECRSRNQIVIRQLDQAHELFLLHQPETIHNIDNVRLERVEFFDRRNELCIGIIICADELHEEFVAECFYLSTTFKAFVDAIFLENNADCIDRSAVARNDSLHRNRRAHVEHADVNDAG